MMDGIAVMKYYNKWSGFEIGTGYSYESKIVDIDGNGIVKMLDGIAIM